MAYITVRSFGEDRFIEKKSEFIGYAKRCVTEEEAKEFVLEIKNSIENIVLYKDIDGFSIYEERQKKNIRDMSKISMGIALRHIDIVCKKNGIDVRYEKRNKKNKIGKEYCINVILR